MRKYVTTLILLLSLIVQEVHIFFPDDVNNQVNLIWMNYKPMTLAWNIRYIENEVLPLLYFMAFYLYVPNFQNRLSVRVFLYFYIVNLIMYFCDFKALENYYKIYLWMAGFWILAYKWKRITAYLWETLERK